MQLIWPVYFFTNVAQALGKHVKWIAAIAAFLVWINDVIDSLVRVVMVQILDAISSLNLAALQNVALGTLDFIGYANAVVPVSEFVTLMGVFVTAWLVVIAVRWVKSFVPTIGN